MLTIEQELKAALACVEILKDLPAASRFRAAKLVYEAFPEEHAEPINGQPSNVRRLVESEEFQSLSTAQDRFLALMGHICEANPSGFASVAPTLKGSRRKYLAKTKDEIADSGTSTEPAQISEGWWVDLNNSTARKRSILEKLMRGMGYPAADVNLAVKAIR